jgi:hypothetical protein
VSVRFDLFIRGLAPASLGLHHGPPVVRRRRRRELPRLPLLVLQGFRRSG